MPTLQYEQWALELDRTALLDALRADALRSAIAAFHGSAYLSPCCCARLSWEGDVTKGAAVCDEGTGDLVVFAWNAVGVVGLACELGFGPVEQFGLARKAVTGGAEDVRAAVPDLPPSLEEAFVRAVTYLRPGNDGAPQAGAGVWFTADRAGGSFVDPKGKLAARASKGATYKLLDWGNPKRLAEIVEGPSMGGPMLFIRRSEGPHKERADAVVASLLERRGEWPLTLSQEEAEAMLACGPGGGNADQARSTLAALGLAWPA